VISLRDIEKGTAAFDGGHTEPIDLPRYRRPRDTGKVKVVPTLIEGEGGLSQKKIAVMRGIHQETVKRIRRDDLNARKVAFKWVPYALNSSQKVVWVQVSRESLDLVDGAIAKMRAGRWRVCQMR
jgi:hypothetical protein